MVNILFDYFIFEVFILSIYLFFSLITCSQTGVYDDITGSSAWEEISARKMPESTLIGLVICEDGAQLFDSKCGSIKPLSYMVANLPPVFHSRINIGMHIASLTGKGFGSWEIFVREMENLWKNGLYVDGVLYQVAVIGVTLDSPAYAEVTHQSTVQAIHGCPKCTDYAGKHDGTRVIYETHRRFLPLKDKRRKKTTAPYVDGIPFFFEDEIRKPCGELSYDQYVAKSEESFLSADKRPVDGCHSVWILDRLPYARYIKRMHDPFHVFKNVCKDILRTLKPSCKGFTNRSSSAQEIEREQKKGRFLNGAVWEFTVREIEISEDRYAGFRHSSDRKDLPRSIFAILSRLKSHDVIVFCIQSARACFIGLGQEEHTENILAIFDLIGEMMSDRINPIYAAEVLLPSFINLAVDHEGLFPGSESTGTLHQLYHVIQDAIQDKLPPRRIWMNSFEHVNQIVKVFCIIYLFNCYMNSDTFLA